MELKELKKCNNCGAQLEPEQDGIIQCKYCGTVYSSDHPEDHDEVEVATLPADTTNNAKKSEIGSGAVFLILIFLTLLIFIIVAFVKSRVSLENDYPESVKLDTAVSSPKSIEEDKKQEGDKVEDPSLATLKILAAIPLDSKTFKKLYSRARKKRDEFSDNLAIYDPTSPQYTNVNAFYIYINKDSSDCNLRFCKQYVSDSWLNINEMIINTDGKNSTYSVSFNKGNSSNSFWEWSYDNVDDYNLPMLVEIANARKVKVKYSGDKYYDVVTINRVQKMALFRELQLYKGLLQQQLKKQ
ncbi:hypothetical protein MUY27_07795 [Mucilaginibacter sp. RS28]|uniref:Uncharacterized protein n=1 Tax=Mucilaginibacter straminoryzae TaxID=2932774 RepID=A0A9X1X4T4_9SPHI|nr:hypothetical protein [Mucilaginibacter straminoryzae]MCJ8209608.1 hypothetical protein [Mucilaginibacter straminoryzae]